MVLYSLIVLHCNFYCFRINPLSAGKMTGCYSFEVNTVWWPVWGSGGLLESLRLMSKQVRCPCSERLLGRVLWCRLSGDHFENSHPEIASSWPLTQKSHFSKFPLVALAWQLSWLVSCLCAKVVSSFSSQGTYKKQPMNEYISRTTLSFSLFQINK